MAYLISVICCIWVIDEQFLVKKELLCYIHMCVLHVLNAICMCC